MRNYILILLICYGSVNHAQSSTNRFAEDEVHKSNSSSSPEGLPPGGGPGQDDEDGGLEDNDDAVPVDGMSGWLIIAGIAIMWYYKAKIIKSHTVNNM